MAESWIAEERGGGNNDVWEDDGWEVTFQFGTIVEHGQRKGDDRHVEEGAEDVTCAWWGKVRSLTREELDVAGFVREGFEGCAEGGMVGERQNPYQNNGEGGREKDRMNDTFISWGE